MVKRSENGTEGSDLERIQELFPSDNLRLHKRDPLSPKKSLLRTKSVAATKLQRALSKSKLVSGDKPATSPSKNDLSSSPSSSKPKTEDIRTFIMDGHVQFTMGVQRQDRHLFLFNDILLIAKSRSSGTYKLKEQVRVCELWLSTCLEDVSEARKSADTSFVMGWPTTNVVASFSSPQTKELWQDKLQWLITEAKEKEGSVLTTIQVTFRDHTCNREFCESVRVNNRHTARDCIKFVLEQLGKQESELGEYQLWVKTGKDDAPYPLIGHEYPFCIKMNFVRELLLNSELELRNLKNIRTNLKCAFVLRSKSRKPSVFIGPRLHKKAKKLRKPTLIHWPFRRQSSKQDTVDSGISSTPGHLFGHSISKICSNGNLPKLILAILNQLFLKGPFTVGIFRKSANARVCRDLRLTLDSHPDYDPQNEPILVLACVFKEYLRSLPDCLLHSSLYTEWLEAVTAKSGWECREHILSLLGRLPPANVLLLRYVLCVLWHIAQRASENKMTPLNLAVCIGPSLLSPNIGNHPSSILHPEVCEVSKLVPKVVAYLIDHCVEIFGDECLRLFGDPPDKDPSRQDSGAEESDSVHSANGVGVNYRRDDSSIDSLERELLEESEPSPKLPSKNKMSLTNLSHDSGLTLSDTQLYTPDEEVDSEESSNGDSRRGGHPLAKSVPHLEMAGLENNPGAFTLYGRSGISIDGSCNEVMRKRRQGLECPRSRYIVSGSGSVSYVRTSSVYENINSHFPVQYSRSYSCGTPHSLLGRQNSDFEASEQQECLTCESTVQKTDDLISSSLTRSASEESLLNKYTPHEPGKKPALHRKGRAPSPPQLDRMWTHKERGQSAPPNERINSPTYRVTPLPDRHAVWFAAHARQADWKRSQSTSRIDDIDYSHDSSTISLVSSDDSTPHVSRSNSKVQELSACSHSDIYNVYQSPNRVSSVCSSSSETSQRSQLSCVSRMSHNSHGSCRSRGSQTSHDSGKSQGSNVSRPPQPPSYQETMSRRMLHRTSATSNNAQLTEQMIQEQTMLSAKARQLYEESVRKYNEEVGVDRDTHHAVLVKVDSQDGTPAHGPLKHGALQRTVSEGHPLRLRQLPPVHVTDAQLKRHIRSQNQKSTSPYSSGLSSVDNAEDWRKEISWSVAQLRRMFSQHSRQNGFASSFNNLQHQKPHVEPQTPTYSQHLNSPRHSGEEYVTVVRIGLSGHPTHTMTLHKRSDSLDSANSGEESFV